MRRLLPADRRGLLLLALLLLSAGALHWCGRSANDSKGGMVTDSISQYGGERGVLPKADMGCFDPNVADSLTMVRVGVKPYLIHCMLQYRRRGGRWRRVEELARVYGMTKADYEALAPRVCIDGAAFETEDRWQDSVRRAADAEYDRQVQARIEASNERRKASDARWQQNRALWRQQREAQQAEYDSIRKRYQSAVPKLKQRVVLDLNSVDSLTLLQVPGLGPVRTQSILQRRRQLGGFTAVSQLSEVVDIPDSIWGWFSVNERSVSRIDLGHGTLNQLRSHPYLNLRQARAIIEYRRRYGIPHLQQLEQMDCFTPEDIERLRGYVK